MEDMQTMMALILSEVRDNGKRLDKIEERMDKMQSDIDQLKQQNTAIVEGQNNLQKSVAEIRDSLTFRIDETEANNKAVSSAMLYDIALLKTKVK